MKILLRYGFGTFETGKSILSIIEWTYINSSKLGMEGNAHLAMKDLEIIK